MNKSDIHFRTLRNAMVAALICVAATGTEVVSAETLSPADTTGIVSHINASGHVRVVQPDGLNARLSKPASATSDSEVAGEDVSSQEAAARRHAVAMRAGYRVQVFDDSNPRTARSSAAAYKNSIESEFPAWRAYVTFNSPYWRVKVGDFRSRAEAESAMAEIRRAFPALKAYLRIVRDRINLYD